jgi:hypothetical protein
MPKRRDPWNLGLHLMTPQIDYGALRAVDSDSDGPNIREAEPSFVEYWENRITHHVARELFVVLFQFAADESVRPCGINYRLVAANIREPPTGTVHVKVSLAERETPPLPSIRTEG